VDAYKFDLSNPNINYFPYDNFARVETVSGVLEMIVHNHQAVVNLLSMWK